MTSIANQTGEQPVETSAPRWKGGGWRWGLVVFLTVFCAQTILNDGFDVHDIYGYKWLLDGAVGGFSAVLATFVFLVWNRFRPTAT